MAQTIHSQLVNSWYTAGTHSWSLKTAANFAVNAKNQKLINVACGILSVRKQLTGNRIQVARQQPLIVRICCAFIPRARYYPVRNRYMPWDRKKLCALNAASSRIVVRLTFRGNGAAYRPVVYVLTAPENGSLDRWMANLAQWWIGHLWKTALNIQGHLDRMPLPRSRSRTRKDETIDGMTRPITWQR